MSPSSLRVNTGSRDARRGALSRVSLSRVSLARDDVASPRRVALRVRVEELDLAEEAVHGVAAPAALPPLRRARAAAALGRRRLELGRLPRRVGRRLDEGDDARDVVRALLALHPPLVGLA